MEALDPNKIAAAVISQQLGKISIFIEKLCSRCKWQWVPSHFPAAKRFWSEEALKPLEDGPFIWFYYTGSLVRVSCKNHRIVSAHIAYRRLWRRTKTQIRCPKCKSRKTYTGDWRAVQQWMNASFASLLKRP